VEDLTDFAELCFGFVEDFDVVEARHRAADNSNEGTQSVTSFMDRIENCIRDSPRKMPDLALPAQKHPFELALK
jgi:hypothetical protein